MDEFNPNGFNSEDKEKAKEVDTTPVNDDINNSQNNNGGSYYSPIMNNDNSTQTQPPVQPVTPPVQPVTPPAQPVTPRQYYTPPVDNTNYQPKKQTQVNGEPVNNPPVKNKNTAVIIVAIILVICLVISGIGIAFAVNSKSGNSTFTNEETTSASDDSAGTASVKDDDSTTATKDSNGNLTTAGVAEEGMDSCVGITVYTNQSSYDYFYGYGNNNSDSSNSSQTASGEGSGVIMSETSSVSYILTNAHVISGGDSYKVTLNDGTELDAKLIGYDSQTDIGVLSVAKTGLKVAEFGNSDNIKIGEDVVAIGCPGGLDFMNSLTKGVVSALARPVSSSIGYNNKCIQIDAAINPGNSGGALFNMQGQVIGINSSKIASTDYEGMGFSIPSNTAIKTANALIKDGYVSGRAKLGLSYSPISNFQNASSILSALEKEGYKDAQGTIVIQEIETGSDLANKDIKQYDMIVAVEGKTLTSTDVLTSALAEKSPGDTIELTIARVENNSIKISKVSCKLIESKE